MRTFVRRVRVRAAMAAAVAGILLLGAPAAVAQADRTTTTRTSENNRAGAVFVQTNDPQGNAVVVFRRRPDGTLIRPRTYPTAGVGGREMGATGEHGSDPLASQGSLLFDGPAGLLFAVNAGSNTVSVFSIHGGTLHLQQVIASGGSFPVGFARSGSLLYVVNAGLAGDVSGFRIANGRLRPIKGSTRSLGLANSTPPSAFTSPSQVGFTPTGGQLVVTTKVSATVDIFAVNAHGLLSAHPVQNAVPGAPFSFGFDAADQLVLVNATIIRNGVLIPDTGSVATYTINSDGTLTTVSGPVSDHQTNPCWNTAVQGFEYVANTTSGTISQYRVSTSGTVTLIRAIAASGIPGPEDLATADGVLYSQSGFSSSVDVFAVGAGGALTLIQTRSVPDGASQEGIVAI